MNVCLLLSRILGSRKDPAVVTYTLSGTITGDEVEGVTITLTGDASDSTTTAADGTYSFSGLVDGDYNVEPSLEGYTFAPTDTDVTISGADDTGNDFVSAVAPLTLPYTYDFSELSAYNNTAIDTVSSSWIGDGSTAVPLVINTGLADNNSVTPTGQVAALMCQSSESTAALFKLPVPTASGLSGIRLAALRRSSASNRLRTPTSEFFGVDVWPNNSPVVLGYADSLSDPNTAYLTTRYTQDGTSNAEMNGAAVTSVGGTAISGEEWSWRLFELNFTAETVRFEVRDYGGSTLYYREQSMNANGIALGAMFPVKAFRVRNSEAGVTGYIARIWIGTLTDDWPT